MSDIALRAEAAGLSLPLPVTVDLSGVDGNAFAILGVVGKAMRRAGVPAEAKIVFVNEATSRDYDHLLQTVMTYVDVE